MSSIQDLQAVIRSYLLGQLDGAAREEFEGRLLIEDRVSEELEVTEDELIDEYLAGKLSVDESAQFENIFLASPERQQKLRFAKALQRYASTHAAKGITIPTSQQSTWSQLFSSPYVRVFAFAAVLIVAALGIWRVFFFQSDVDKGLMALNEAYKQQRPLESRITQLDYAPFVVTRGPGTEQFNYAELQRAELTLLEALKANPTPAVNHALGKVYLAKKDFDRAIEQFNKSVESDQNNARLYNDLGAAYFERGRLTLEKGKSNPTSPNSGKSLEDFARSLEALNKALQVDPKLTESLFNRALVYEAMVLPEQAAGDWKKYLELDPTSRWAEEARRHLSELEERKKARAQVKGDLLREFLDAKESGNDDAAYNLITRNTETLGGHLVWWQLAGAYLSASANSNTISQARSYLDALSYAGELQRKRNGDEFISQLAHFYASTPAQKQNIVRDARRMIDEAHDLMARSQAAEALKLYQEAKAGFDQAGDQCESRFAEYWIGYSYQRVSNFELSLSILSRLAADCERRNYLWLSEKAGTMVGTLQGDLNQFSTAINHHTRALETSTRINDSYNQQKNLTTLAYFYKNLGEQSEALNFLQRGLESANDFWPGSRQMYRNYYTSASVLNSFGYYSAAAEYEKAALLIALNETKDPGFEHQCYVALATIYGKLKDFSEARRYAELSYEKAKKLDQSTSVRPVAESLLQLAHVNRQTGQHDRALTYYDEAVRLAGELKLVPSRYEAHKGRLLGYIAQHQDALAKNELPVVLNLFEEHRSKIRDEKNRNSFFDQEQNTYDIAIDFEYSRTGDYQKAYEYSEKSRARSLLDQMNAGANPLTLPDIQNAISQNTQILQYAVLDDKLIAWLIAKDSFEVAHYSIPATSLTEKVLSYSQLLASVSGSDTEQSRQAAAELYEILIKPVERSLAKNKQVCVVPDKVLNVLPFNALISPSRQYLINDYSLVFAPSSSVFIEASRAANERSVRIEERLLSVGDPLFNLAMFPDLSRLPSANKEAVQIAEHYKTHSLLVGKTATEQRVTSGMGQADVVHIASHYVVNEQNPTLSKLLLTPELGAKEEQADGVLKANEIAERKLPITRLVTLSACRSGVERYYKGEGMIGMSRTFLAAGVPLVVASLWPVDSEPTADLMSNFHRYRKQSRIPTAEALRRAQLDVINNPRRVNVAPYYWAPFVVIGGHAEF